MKAIGSPSRGFGIVKEYKAAIVALLSQWFVMFSVVEHILLFMKV